MEQAEAKTAPLKVELAWLPSWKKILAVGCGAALVYVVLAPVVGWLCMTYPLPKVIGDFFVVVLLMGLICVMCCAFFSPALIVLFIEWIRRRELQRVISTAILEWCGALVFIGFVELGWLDCGELAGEESFLHNFYNILWLLFFGPMAMLVIYASVADCVRLAKYPFRFGCVSLVVSILIIALLAMPMCGRMMYYCGTTVKMTCLHSAEEQYEFAKDLLDQVELLNFPEGVFYAYREYCLEGPLHCDQSTLWKYAVMNARIAKSRGAEVPENFLWDKPESYEKLSE